MKKRLLAKALLEYKPEAMSQAEFARLFGLAPQTFSTMIARKAKVTVCWAVVLKFLDAYGLEVLTGGGKQ